MFLIESHTRQSLCFYNRFHSGKWDETKGALLFLPPILTRFSTFLDADPAIHGLKTFSFRLLFASASNNEFLIIAMSQALNGYSDAA